MSTDILKPKLCGKSLIVTATVQFVSVSSELVVLSKTFTVRSFSWLVGLLQRMSTQFPTTTITVVLRHRIHISGPSICIEHSFPLTGLVSSSRHDSLPVISSYHDHHHTNGTKNKVVSYH